MTRVRKPYVKSGKGFTLVELMVVMAIMVTITAVVLSSQGSFNKTLILANTAYDIGLTIRSAESFGLGSRVSGSAVTGCAANAGYGIHFQRGNSLLLFADTSPITPCATPDQKPGDYKYTGGSDTIAQTYVLGNGITVDDFCVYSSGIESCAIAHGGGLSSLDIVFARPNPDAVISADGSSYTSACITVTSPQGGYRYISVTVSGEITANVPVCQ